MQAINFLCYDLYRHALIRHAPGSKDELRVRERLLAGALAGAHAALLADFLCLIIQQPPLMPSCLCLTVICCGFSEMCVGSQPVA